MSISHSDHEKPGVLNTAKRILRYGSRSTNESASSLKPISENRPLTGVGLNDKDGDHEKDGFIPSGTTGASPKDPKDEEEEDRNRRRDVRTLPRPFTLLLRSPSCGRILTKPMQHGFIRLKKAKMILYRMLDPICFRTFRKIHSLLITTTFPQPNQMQRRVGVTMLAALGSQTSYERLCLSWHHTGSLLQLRRALRSFSISMASLWMSNGNEKTSMI